MGRVVGHFAGEFRRENAAGNATDGQSHGGLGKKNAGVTVNIPEHS